MTDADFTSSDPAGDQVLCMMYQDSSPAFAATAGQCVFGPPGQTWNITSCDPGTFTVDNVHTGTTDTSGCGPGSDEAASFTAPGYPGLDKVLCLAMNWPLAGTAQQYACLSESGSGSNINFSNVSSCGEANVIVEGRTYKPRDPSFCGQYAWYTWESNYYPNLGFTVCLGRPN
jgi:hypothetical protein